MSSVDPLPGKIREILQKGLGRFKELETARQKHVILGGITLALGIGLFFSAFLDSHALAARNRFNSNPVDQAVLDPLNRIGKGLQEEQQVEFKDACRTQDKATSVENIDNQQMHQILDGSPMAQMIPALAKRDKRISSFLVAIAKKESSWGVHTPKKGGRECYNYWGYRGKENPTQSGYSCFDSPEQAVKVVGDRIESLVNKRIDTPTKMVVWKCGGDCNAAGGQAAANQWISDVAFYYKKLNS
jgi:hypothetical protein